MSNVTVNFEPIRASGNRKSWAKHVTSVDTSQRGGYAFIGDFLDVGENSLPAGAVVLEVIPTGSAKNGGKTAHVQTVDIDGSLTVVDEYDYDHHQISLRDCINGLLPDDPDGETANPLASVSTDDLRAELARRGIAI